MENIKDIMVKMEKYIEQYIFVKNSEGLLVQMVLVQFQQVLIMDMDILMVKKMNLNIYIYVYQYCYIIMMYI